MKHPPLIRFKLFKKLLRKTLTSVILLICQKSNCYKQSERYSLYRHWVRKTKEKYTISTLRLVEDHKDQSSRHLDDGIIHGLDDAM